MILKSNKIVTNTWHHLVITQFGMRTTTRNKEIATVVFIWATVILISIQITNRGFPQQSRVFLLHRRHPLLPEVVLPPAQPPCCLCSRWDREEEGWPEDLPVWRNEVNSTRTTCTNCTSESGRRRSWGSPWWRWEHYSRGMTSLGVEGCCRCYEERHLRRWLPTIT